MIIIFLLFLLSVLLVLLAANEVYFRFVLSHVQEQQIYYGRRGKYDIVAFGSTYCRYGIEFPSDVNGFNFGFSGQFFYYTDKMLRDFIPHCLNPGGTVLIIIADLVFAEVGKGLYGPERYPLFLSKISLGQEYSTYKFAKMRFPIIFHPVLLIRLFKYFAKVILNKNHSEFDTLTKNALTEEQVVVEARKRCDSWCKQFRLKDTISDDIDPKLEIVFSKTRKILTSMIQYCLDRGFKPVLVVTPVSKAMTKCLSDAFLQKVLFDNINMANIQNVPFWNFLKDPRFQDVSLYANNADCLNVTGRRIFTKCLVTEYYKIKNT